MITKKVQPIYDDKNRLCGTRIEYRIFGLAVFVKTLQLPEIDDEGERQHMYFDF